MNRTSKKTENLEIDIAVLEERTKVIKEGFDTISEKFDSLIDRVEHIMVNSAEMLTRHDEQIKSLSSQVKAAEVAIQNVVSDLSLKLEKITSMNAQRIKALEQRQYIWMGAATAFGVVISWLAYVALPAVWKYFEH